MAQRIIRTDDDLELLITYLRGQKLPLAVSVERYSHRTVQQNKLQRLWIKEIAEQLPDNSAEYWRGYCKLHFGVPIMRAENEEFQQTYDEIIRPLPYEAKIRLMMVPIDLPVTRIMNLRQKQQYLDDMMAHFLEQGVALTEPEPMMRAA